MVKKVFHLVHIQLWAVISDMLSIGNKKTRKPRALYIGVILFILFMGFIAFFYCLMIGNGLMMYNCIELLPALMMAVTSIIVLITTVLKVKGTIFGFKDYDMVMSLPVSTAGIVASRLILLYALNLLFVIIIMLPMTIAYGILAVPTAQFYIISIVMMFFLPLIPIIAASILGSLITYFASRFRYSNIVNIVVSMLLLVALMGLSFSFQDQSGQKLANMSRTLTNQVNSIYPLAGMYTKAVTEYDYSALAAYLFISILFFLIFSYLVGKIFKKMNTMVMTGTSRRNYKMGELKVSNQFAALYKKEIKRYFASPLYVLNTGFGIVLLTIATIALFFINFKQLFGNSKEMGFFFLFIPVIISFCVVTCCTTMASISLEGKNLWIIKSLPVKPKTVYQAKLAVNFTVLIPAVIDAVIIGFILQPGLVQGIFTLLAITVCGFFTAIFGLLVNLKFPNFNWTNETAVIKQSASALIAVFTGMAVAGLQVVLFILLSSYVSAYLIYTIVIAAVDLILYRTLMVWGEKRFVQL